MKSLNEYFDHTVLKPEAGEKDIIKLCQEAIENQFYAVCVNSSYVSLAKEKLTGSNVKVASVVGFPLGACDTATKVFEAKGAIENGADEIDMVINIGAVKDGRYNHVLTDIIAVVEACGDKAILKVILETCLLTDEEIVESCLLAKNAGAAFVKTSTGFSTAGATAHHVSLMKKTVGSNVMVKASGGIRDLKTTLEMIKAGADRIGASASVNIMKEEETGQVGSSKYIPSKESSTR
jgi:deoxyribose-phosphate aldolase